MGSNPTLSAIVSEARASARARSGKLPSLTVGLLTLAAENISMMRKLLIRGLTISLVAAAVISAVVTADAQTRRKPTKRAPVCGNPNVTCGGEITFQPHELPIRVPRNAVIYDSDLFYAVILRSVPSLEER